MHNNDSVWEHVSYSRSENACVRERDNNQYSVYRIHYLEGIWEPCFPHLINPSHMIVNIVLVNDI